MIARSRTYSESCYFVCYTSKLLNNLSKNVVTQKKKKKEKKKKKKKNKKKKKKKKRMLERKTK